MAKYHKKNECKMCKVVHDRLGNKAGCTHLCHTPSPKPCCDSCRSKTIPYKCYAEDCKNCHQAKHEGKILEPNECAKCGLVDHTHPNKFCDSFVSEAQVSKEKDLLFIVPPIYPPEGKCKDCQFEGNDHSFECPQYVEKDPPEVSPEKKEGLNRISGEAAFELGFKQGQESIMKSGASVGKPKKVKECTCYGLVGTKKHAKECELSVELCECGKEIPEAYVQQSMIKFCSVDCLVKHFPPEVSPEEKLGECLKHYGLDPKCTACAYHKGFVAGLRFEKVSPEKKCEHVVSTTYETECGKCGKTWLELGITPPAKEEKECGKDKCQMAGNCPTLTEQKGESWEEEFDKNTPKTDDKLLDSEKESGTYEFGLKVQKGDEIFTVTDWFNIKKWVAAKKKEWEAQKEQAVKAEIRERIEKMNDDGINDYDGKTVDAVISLLSDKVNH